MELEDILQLELVEAELVELVRLVVQVLVAIQEAELLIIVLGR